MAAGSCQSRRELLENAKRAALLTGLAPLFEATAAEAFSVPAGAMQGGKAGELDGFVQGLVLECENLEDELAFWTQGLKMKVLRRSSGRVVVGFGPESLSLQENGAHFSLELVQARGESKSRTNVQLQLKLPARTNLIIDAEEAGGKIQPVWFGTSGYTAFATPNGYLVRIETTKDKTVAYPVQGVSIQTEDVTKTAKELSEMLSIQPDDGFLLPFSDPKSKTLRYMSADKGGQRVTLQVEPLNAPPPPQMSKKALLQKKQEEAKRREEEGEEEEEEESTQNKKAPPSKFTIAVVSQKTKGASSSAATSTGVRVQLLSKEAFEDKMPPPPPAAARPAASAPKSRAPSTDDEEEEE